MATCAVCSATLPAVRAPTSRRQMLWGGWTCQGCGTELDRHAQPLQTRMVREASVLFSIAPHRSPFAAVGFALAVVASLTLTTFGITVAVYGVPWGIPVAALGAVALFAVFAAFLKWMLKASVMLEVWAHRVDIDEERIPYGDIVSLVATDYDIEILTADTTHRVPYDRLPYDALCEAVQGFEDRQAAAAPVDEQTARALQKLRTETA